MAVPMAVVSVNWPAPDNIAAVSTTRYTGLANISGDDEVGADKQATSAIANGSQGSSRGSFSDFNLATHVGDQASAVAANRDSLLQGCSDLQHIQWLEQVHGNQVVVAGTGAPMQADASYSSRANLACAVLTADCLPLLICDRAGTQLAAVHAGWRGLAAGVIENTLAHFSCSAQELLVWLGPAISQRHFEVGSEVRQNFLAASNAQQREAISQAFVAHSSRPGFYFADLYQLARLRLQRAGVEAVYGGEYCSYSDSDSGSAQFFSYRRDGQCGRMASLIYRRS